MLVGRGLGPNFVFVCMSLTYVEDLTKLHLLIGNLMENFEFEARLYCLILSRLDDLPPSSVLSTALSRNVQ